jgi:hypothetical protein
MPHEAQRPSQRQKLKKVSATNNLFNGASLITVLDKRKETFMNSPTSPHTPSSSNVAVYDRVAHVDLSTTYDAGMQECLDCSSKRLGCAAAACFSDYGVSGNDMDRRGLSRLRDAVREGTIKHVVVRQTEALSRNPTHLMNLYREFNEHGAKLYCVYDDGPITMTELDRR